MRRRPDVELRITKTVHAGDAVLAELHVRSRSKTPVDFIDLHLEGTETMRVEGQINAPRHLVSLVARVAENATLAEGEHRYRASFPLPDDVPCTYLGVRAEIRYAMRLDISIPWWLDVQESYEVLVSPRPTPRPARAPAASTTAGGGRPFIEVSLDDQVFAPGEEIAGAVALGNLQGRKVRAVELSLVGFERLRPAGDRAIEAHRFSAFRRVDSRDEGRELPFRFKIPPHVAPSFDAGWTALFWGFVVRVELARADDIVHTTPVVLGVFDRPPALGALRRQIGSGRWRAVWGAVGARHGLSLDPHELRLTGALAGCAVAVWIDVGTSAAGALVGELRWSSWGLDLQIGLKRLQISLGAGDDEGFGTRYRVRGREPAQVYAVVAGPLRRALLAFDEVRLDDEHVTAWSRTPGHDQPWLGAFLERLAALAAELAAVAPRIPPPAAMAAARSAWEAFSRRLHGRLEVGRMSVRDALLDGARFHVETCFDRSPTPDRTEVTLVLEPPLEAPVDLEDPEQLRAASPAVRELLQALRARTRALCLTERALVAVVPAPVDDPAALRDLMEAELLLAQRLRGAREVGPYR